MIARILPVFALALVALSASCRKGTVESYRIPKEKDPEMPMMTGGASPGSNGPMGDANAGGNMANTPVATAEGGGLTWSAPANWKPKAGSAMRKGSFAVPGEAGAEGDLSITAFPGDVGGELANVNRWRGQVQLPPIGEGELAGAVQRIEANGLQFGVVDIVGGGTNPQRILGAYVPYGGATWFIKLVGPDQLVEKAKPEFLSFVRSVKPTPAAQ